MKKLALLIISMLLLAACTSGVEEPAAQPITHATMATTPKAGDTIAIMDTSHGTLKILLYTEHVPETTKNFIEHSNEGRYEGAPFHRVIKDFMIQGGDFENQNGTGGYGYKGPGTSIPDEFHDDLSHIKGALSMANAGPNTGGSQFFIVQNEGGTDFLDGRHAIFGYVFEGLEHVDKIADIETDGADRPAEPVLIKTVTITEYK